MRYLVSMLAGMVVGVLLFLLLLYHNPFFDEHAISPLSVTEAPLMELSYSAVPKHALAYLNNGESGSEPVPADIAELWEPTIRKTRILVAELADGAGEPAGIGIKFVSDSESTRLLRAEAMVDSAWHIYLPESGSMLIDQRENFWSYARNVVLPARWNSADSWRGTWFGITTAGPRALGTGNVRGGSGRYAGLSSEAVEALSARAYSAVQGPVAMTGNLTIALPKATAD